MGIEPDYLSDQVALAKAPGGFALTISNHHNHELSSQSPRSILMHTPFTAPRVHRLGRLLLVSTALLCFVSGRDAAAKSQAADELRGTVPDKYIAQSYSGDSAKALDAIVGEQGWPFEPLQIAMRTGKGMEGWLTALRFRQLMPLQISGYEQEMKEGHKVYTIHFTASNGRLDASFDSATHFLFRIWFRAQPQGAPKESLLM
jgi:hypothetical protein